MKTDFKLIVIENDHPVTELSDSCFLCHMQRAALLGLKSAGYLNEMEHRHAEKILLQQYRKRIGFQYEGAHTDD